MVMRGNGVEVRRLAMHRSVQTEYWDTVRACIFQDGSMVLWDSTSAIPTTIASWLRRPDLRHQIRPDVPIRLTQPA